ncbi:MAG: hypothetical protein J6B72_04035 [Clostridia bacterium]|nr:hypothetical protein [Clostridia bacterium]
MNWIQSHRLFSYQDTKEAKWQENTNKRKKEAERTENLNKNFQSIVAEMQTQNKILAQQVEDAKRESEEAKKDARNAKVFSWISFAVSTLIAAASLIVAILK